MWSRLGLAVVPGSRSHGDDVRAVSRAASRAVVRSPDVPDWRHEGQADCLHVATDREWRRETSAAPEVDQERSQARRQEQGQGADVAHRRVGELELRVVEPVADGTGEQAPATAGNDEPGNILLSEVDRAGDPVDGSPSQRLVVETEAVDAGSVGLEQVDERVGAGDVEPAPEDGDRASTQHRTVAVGVAQEAGELDDELLLPTPAVAVTTPVPVPGRADIPGRDRAGDRVRDRRRRPTGRRVNAARAGRAGQSGRGARREQGYSQCPGGEPS